MTGVLLLIEFCLTCIIAAAAYVVPRVVGRSLPRTERWLQPLVQRPRLAVIVVGLTALAARAAVLPVLPVPEPTIHDEFSHLLAADTFAHGRLANPTHPMWMHFESFHINQIPTYASMFFPAQGLLLALGQVVFGHPFVGVWLSVGVMCAAICWMLQGWIPAKWAFVGGFLAVIRLGIFSYWANSYYGGSLSAIGGALVLGALPRIKRRQHVGDAVLMAAGLAILANTRPFEGVLFGVPVAVALLAWMFGRRGPRFAIGLARIVLPICLLTALTISGMSYYFWRVTGSPFRVPYQVNMETYGLLYFPWEQLKPPPEYHHAVMRDFYLGEYNRGRYELAHSHPFEKIIITIMLFWLFFLGPLLTLPLCCLAMPSLGKSRKGISRKTQFLLVVVVMSALGLMLTIYVPFPHYAAPSTCVVFALVMQGMRHARIWRRKQQWTGRAIVLALPLVCVVLLVFRIALAVFSGSAYARTPQYEFVLTWGSPRWINTARAQAVEELSRNPGGQLAVVRYQQGHDLIFNEWVYNEADINNAKIVWAREMSPPENQNLIHYFHDRKAWLVEADENPPRISPYVPSANSNAVP